MQKKIKFGTDDGMSHAWINLNFIQFTCTAVRGSTHMKYIVILGFQLDVKCD